MLTIVRADSDYIHYRVSGKVTSTDIDLLFSVINPMYASQGKVNLLSEVSRFGGYDGLRTVLKVLGNEPTLLWKADKYTLVTADTALRRVFQLGALFVFRPAVKTFPNEELDLAKAWITK